MKLSKAIQNRINEVLEMASKVDSFYCDFGSTIEYTIWDLEIKVNQRNVVIKHGGYEPDKITFWISREDDVADLKWYLAQFRKSIKKELKYA